MSVKKARRPHSRPRAPAAPVRQTSPPERDSRIQLYILLLFSVLLLAYYGIALTWSFKELFFCVTGMVLLWGPIGSLLYVTLQKAIPDRTVRLAFGSVASYTLTTLLYFAASVLHVGWLFVTALIAAAASAVWRALRSKAPITLPRLDGLLLLIVAASLVTTIPYSNVLTKEPSGDRIFSGYFDHLYHAGLEYELSRHVPPLQATIRGGTPERAYHMFSHLTVALLARFTRQPEMLRVHAVYHYAAITVLICLAMYGIGVLLMGSALAGYVCAFLPFLFAIATPALIPNSQGYFFFTLLPHATSSIFPTLWTSPQMYSGIAVMYGVLLGVAALIRAARRDALLLVFALMLGALLRFRIHCWVAATPVFLVYASVMWFRTRRAAWLLSAAVVIVVSGLLYAEMLLPSYMQGTAQVHLGVNQLAQIEFYRAWPLAPQISLLISRLFPSVLSTYIWQVVCVAGFALCNMLGFVAFAALAFGAKLLKQRSAADFYWFTLGIAAVSILCAICLNANYDQYSIPGQLLFHLGWYTLPLVGVFLTWLITRLRRVEKYAFPLVATAGVICAIASPLSQRALLSRFIQPDVIAASSWDALQYLKERTPGEAIVLSTSPRDRRITAVSGLGGRSGYQDYAPNPVDNQALQLNPQDDRARVLKELAATRDPAVYCSVITGTPITHVLEEPSDPLMPNLPCLRRLFTARDAVTSVWQVVRP